MATKLTNAVLCFSHNITVQREKTGYYVKGRYQESAPEVLTIKAAVQPLRGRERLLLPEGMRAVEAIKIYSTMQFKTGNVQSKQRADRLVYDGCAYEVQSVENWTVDGGYYKAIAVRKGQ